MFTSGTETTLLADTTGIPGLEELPIAVTPEPSLMDASTLAESILEFFPDASTLGDDLTPIAETLTGTLTFVNGVVTSDLSSSAGSLVGSLDLAAEITELVDEVTGLTGSAIVGDGLLTGELSNGDDLLSGTVDLATLVDESIVPLVREWDDTVSVQNGQVPLTIPTEFGDISGTLTFGTGELLVDLTTPFGDIDDAIAFEEGTEIPFTVDGFEGVLDLSSGAVVVDILPTFAGGEVSIPFSSLSYDLTITDGIATATIPTAVGDLPVTFDLAQVTDDLLTEILTEATGTIDLTGGLLTANIDSSLGALDTTLDLAQFLTEAAADATTLNGTLTFGDGTVVSDLTGSFGDLVGSLDLVELADDLMALLDEASLPDDDAPVTEAIA